MERVSPPSSAHSGSRKSFASAHSLSTSYVSTSRPPSRPGSKGQRRPNGSAGAGRTTPALSPVPPEYLRPVVRSAVRRWKKLHEQHMMDKLIQTKDGKREADKEAKENADKLARKIPVELLAREWLNLERATIESRAYLIDQLLPTVILGLERLLVETERRGLTEKGYDPNFNPLNFLGQYLMRNNPRYSNFSESSPYVRGLRQVSEELRLEIFQFNDNKLAKLKAASRKKREEREQQAKMRYVLHEKKLNAIQHLFDLFVIGDEIRIDQTTVESAVKSFTEIAERLPEELQPYFKIVFELDVSQSEGKRISRKEFVEFLQNIVEDTPIDLFDQFVAHIESCAKAYKNAIYKDARKITLTNLFLACDHDQIGILDRQRILILFEKFYDSCSEEVRDFIRNPRKWPVREVHEELRFVDEKEAKEEAERQKTLVFEDGELEEEEMIIEPIPEQKPLSPDLLPQSETEEKPKIQSPEPQDISEKITGSLEPENVPSEEKPESPNPEAPPAEEISESPKPEAAPAEEKPESPKSETVPTENAETSEQPADSTETKSASPEPEKEVSEEKSASSKEGSATPFGTRVREVTFEDEILQSEKERESSKEEEKDADEGPKNEDEEEPTVSESKLESGTVQEEGDVPGRTGAQSVSFAEGTQFFTSEKTGVSLKSNETGGNRSQSSAFDEVNLTADQFVHITETFLSDNPDPALVEEVVQYVREGYIETEDERMRRLLEANKKALAAKRKVLMDELFETWDNDGSGYLDLEDVETVVLKFREGAYKKPSLHSKKELKSNSRHHDNRLTKREFRSYLNGVVRFANDDESMEEFVGYLLISVKRSYAEKLRGEARRKWLLHIRVAGNTGGASMEPIYRAVFQALYKDAEAHGEGKRVSANLSILEASEGVADQGNMMLRFVAATPDDAPIVLGRTLYQTGRGISFQAVESGKPLHVPKVSAHTGVMLFNPTEDKDGCCVVVPLKDRKKRVFGTLGVDTLNDTANKNLVFAVHEIQFFQGVATAFSVAYHNVEVHRKTIRVAESALSWIARRSPTVTSVTYYIKEPDRPNSDFVLRRMLITDENGVNTIPNIPPRLERRDNLFRSYLFESVDTSESVAADAYGERHLAVPIRNVDGLAVAVVDVGIGKLKELPDIESKEVMKMLKLLQMAYLEICKAAHGEDTEMGDAIQSDAELLFDKLMLTELRANVSVLTPQNFAEMRSYKEPPRNVHLIMQAVLALFYPDQAREGLFENWGHCKKYIKSNLGKQIMDYDPQAQSDKIPVDLINKCLGDVPTNMTERHGSKPAMLLYNWVFVSVSLVEHTLKVQQNKKQEALPPVPEETIVEVPEETIVEVPEETIVEVPAANDQEEDTTIPEPENKDEQTTETGEPTEVLDANEPTEVAAAAAVEEAENT